jgi:hypothetical protein
MTAWTIRMPGAEHQSRFRRALCPATRGRTEKTEND